MVSVPLFLTEAGSSARIFATCGTLMVVSVPEPLAALATVTDVVPDFDAVVASLPVAAAPAQPARAPTRPTATTTTEARRRWREVKRDMVLLVVVGAVVGTVRGRD
ncbi:hypothetical protein GCM10025867_16740 [Frondihabitans sucicola]|uniref:Uncharacterized protein n=1 Tax=Frondihabitans sucicola TaxID=1268041 RepID=A0ABN6Y136_9MICO|nr:hypothetical protein GCM10025867_16740 [Frondihabitans sucicola]